MKDPRRWLLWVAIAAGLAWAGVGEGGRDLTGVDVNAWALGEAAFAYRCFQLRARTVRVCAFTSGSSAPTLPFSTRSG